MLRDPTDLLPPRIVIVDDERPVHAAIRLRLGRDCEITSFQDPREALTAIRGQAFDLCIVDIHMPHLHGLAFVEAAAQADPALGCVVLSAFDTDENLRRAIPLHVYDFLPKPLPERDGFEARLPEWVARTRQRRRERALAGQADALDHDLGTARLEREVELVASESARDALHQTANLLTTIHAHLVAATTLATARARNDPGFAHLARNLEMGLRTAEAAVTVAESFFDSAYGSRETSPALLETGLRHASSIAARVCRADEAHKALDLAPVPPLLPLHGLTGIDLLLMLVPAIAVAFHSANHGTTVRLGCTSLARLDDVLREPRNRDLLWLNRRNAVTSHAGAMVELTATGLPSARGATEAWLRGEPSPWSAVPSRGLVLGLQKCRGLLALALAPSSTQFRLVLALPT